MGIPDPKGLNWENLNILIKNGIYNLLQILKHCSAKFGRGRLFALAFFGSTVQM